MSHACKRYSQPVTTVVVLKFWKARMDQMKRSRSEKILTFLGVLVTKLVGYMVVSTGSAEELGVRALVLCCISF